MSHHHDYTTQYVAHKILTQNEKIQKYPPESFYILHYYYGFSHEKKQFETSKAPGTDNCGLYRNNSLETKALFQTTKLSFQKDW